MTQISFHFNIENRIHYACRLLRKAARLQSKVVVLGLEPELSQLDQQLWTFEPLDFVPHVLVVNGKNVERHLQATPLWLVDNLAQPPHLEVLLNLSSEVPLEFERFAQLIEIVSQDPQDRQQARQRWKHYDQLKAHHAIIRHDVSQETTR